mmetsp:Transcript_20882/g.57912  ORF Transcript_20882/g.57912 Transcript_20882/m.57912 type:complete len:253 (+) Transcript_20882:184-942(+)|eukprot:CAMPEP_0117665964 /NCGR_PEP_ID=MMETSP0804-20121206/10105_1 /TAXON_ID=1074897 /ORGANISM="Tetraselmis astigmatica, Strain CCMP880" /LENGTH=252 /DNA_ID=CAMNT_0005473441 /DNA_START=90 /DNA_END=848 /DNA_ORIENTATION=+
MRSPTVIAIRRCSAPSKLVPGSAENQWFPTALLKADARVPLFRHHPWFPRPPRRMMSSIPATWDAWNVADVSIVVHKWIDQYIIGLDLCPFAKPARKATTILVSKASNAGECMSELLEEAVVLAKAADSKPVTSLLVIPPELAGDFPNFMEQLFQPAEDVIHDAGLSADIHLVPFHPLSEYEEDCSDYALRSPFPTIHILRKCDIETAQEKWEGQGKQLVDIPEGNAAMLQGLGLHALEDIMRDIKGAAGPS